MTTAPATEASTGSRVLAVVLALVAGLAAVPALIFCFVVGVWGASATGGDTTGEETATLVMIGLMGLAALVATVLAVVGLVLGVAGRPRAVLVAGVALGLAAFPYVVALVVNLLGIA